MAFEQTFTEAEDTVQASDTALNWTASSSGPQRLDNAATAVASEQLLATESDWTAASVSIADPSTIMYQDDDLVERLMMETQDQPRQEPAANQDQPRQESAANQVQPKPTFNNCWPQFDHRMETLGMVRDPSQRETEPDGDCALHVISAQVNKT